MAAHWPRWGSSISQPQAPTTANPADRRRAIEQAQAQSQVGDYYTGLPLDVVGMQRVSPDQLSGLLSARMEDRSRNSPMAAQIQSERIREYLLR